MSYDKERKKKSEKLNEKDKKELRSLIPPTDIITHDGSLLDCVAKNIDMKELETDAEEKAEKAKKAK